MKKISTILSVVLSAVMIACLFGCAKQEAAPETEAVTEAATEAAKETEAEEVAAEDIVYADSIPLGGSAGELPLDGPAYGEYKEVPVSDVYDGTDFDEAHAYVDYDSDTSIIEVYRWARDGKSIEELTAEESALYSDGYYRTADASDWGYGTGDTAGYFYSSEMFEGVYYFCEFDLIEDGDDVVEIIYNIKTEEVELGDSGKCICIPSGYEDKNTAGEEAHGQFFYGTYDYSYFLPDIWIAEAENSYEWLTWWWDSEYPDGIPYTEEEFNAQSNGAVTWGPEEDAAFYKKLGADMTYRFVTRKNGVDISFYSLDMPEFDTHATEILFSTENGTYSLWAGSDNSDFYPFIGGCIVDSLHSKCGSISISLGGNCGEFKAEGPAYGEYEEIAAEGWFEYPDAKESHVYADEKCDTPYIAVYRVAKGDQTLEEYTASEAEFLGTKRYVMTSSEGYDYVPSDELGYVCAPATTNGEYYYLDNVYFEDGDDFVQIMWICKSEEVVLGDSGKALYVPAGEYTTHDTEAIGIGGVFLGAYEESYYMPTILIAKGDPSYEHTEDLWAINYPDGLPFTEEELKEAQSCLFASVEENKEAYEKYYALFGYETPYIRNFDVDGVKGTIAMIKSEEFNEVCDHIVFFIGDELYEAWLTSELAEDAPFIGKGIMNSLHDVK